MKERGESSVTNFLLYSALSMWAKIRKYTMKGEMVGRQRVVIKASPSFLPAL